MAWGRHPAVGRSALVLLVRFQSVTFIRVIYPC